MSTIKHISIYGRPVVQIIVSDAGINAGQHYAVSYGSSAKHTTLIQDNLKAHTEFPLWRIIKDYITHYGYEKAVSILIEKGIINSRNAGIDWSQ